MIALMIIYGIKGYRKGFFYAFLSLIFFFLSIFLSFKLREFGSDILRNVSFLSDFAENTLPNLLNDVIPGVFTSVEGLIEFLSVKQSLFYFLLLKFANGINFEGELTSGQILGGTVADQFFNLVSFLLIYLLLTIVFFVIKKIIVKILVRNKLLSFDRVIGSLFGLLKGAIFAVFVLFVVILFSNLTANQSVFQFATSGNFSKFLYENFIIKIIDIIF